MDAAGTEGRRPWGRYAIRALLSLAVAAALALWLLASLVLWALRCDDNCSEGDAEAWHWTGQLVLSGSGVLLAVAGLILGFTKYKQSYRFLLAAAAACAFVWTGWLFSGEV